MARIYESDGEPVDDKDVPTAYGSERREVGLEAQPLRVYLVEGSHPDDTPSAPSEAWENTVEAFS